ncbi:MAG: hypothetical protein ABI255_04080 [Microbacteriaceae bacterium]
MSQPDDEPELVGFVPIERKPAKRRRIMRVFVILAIAALVVPGVITTISVASRTAERTCAIYVAHYRPDAVGSSARFEIFAPGGPGWQCYWLDSEEHASYFAPLGLIPTTPRAPEPADTTQS